MTSSQYRYIGYIDSNFNVFSCLDFKKFNRLKSDESSFY